MPTYRAWLNDIRPSPYADQLNMGFRGLRFVRGLEAEYRTHLLEELFELKRIALSMGVLIWVALAVLDSFMIQGVHLWWMLAVRLLVLIVLLVCGVLILQRRHPHLLQPLSLLCILALGIGTALDIGIAHRADPHYPYEGLFLVSMAAYFLVGLRLTEAVICASLVLLVYVLVEIWAGLPPARLLNNLLLLVVGNLMGAVGCYLLEYKSREHFLVSNLLQLLADHDSLTGLHNRRSFNRHFERIWRQAQRNGQSLALLLCDIDHFKAYNDRYGHQAGDRALQQVAALIEQAARRPLDMAVRLGGEEFGLLLFDISAEEAMLRAESLRQSVTEAAIEHLASDTAQVLSLSIGVAAITPGSGQELSHLYAHADRALYEAKAFGRDRVAS
ncbi:diguanylate cyclase domain-containing protein [Pseudomonas sp. NCHU5208]|uniref:GGDEF domain-containing protein n=1 Tax=unclassified Pseudomonas TaxID=196821 RepID=UPI003F9DC920